MNLVKVSETTKPQLDWLAAKCWYSGEFDKDRVFLYHSGYEGAKHTVRIANQETCTRDLSFKWEPTADWSQGGPILEREIDKYMRALGTDGKWVYVTMTYAMNMGTGPSLLIAAMRCYVASKLGDEVEVPNELS